MLSNEDFFGCSITCIGDLNSVIDILIGAKGDDDGGSARGAVWLLFLE
ncbi:MAG: hypothetical protein KAS64_08155 [Spirochaetes bacterium]|nr:hypothetical protein [Spirochaetota bacterium]